MYCPRLVSSVLLIMLPNALGLTRGRNAHEGEFPFAVRILVSEKAKEDEPAARSFPEISKVRCALKSGINKKSPVTLGGHNTITSEDNRPSRYTDEEEFYRSRMNLGGMKEDLIKEFSSNNATRISAGVLISTTRVLTTCSSVASFTGTKTIDFPLNQVLINAGSIHSSGEFGEFKFPNSSTRHPYCHFMISTRTTLFDYGIYEVETPFGEIAKTGYIAPVRRSFKNSDDMETALEEMLRTSKSRIQCHTVGWGNFDKRFEGKGAPDNFERFSTVLQTTSMEIVDFPECYNASCKQFRNCLNPLLEYGFFCAKAASGGPCIEDWSSPLICNGDIFGIHVLPQRCSDTGIPRLFLRVDLAFDFVFGLKSESYFNSADSYTVAGLLTLCWYQYT